MAAQDEDSGEELSDLDIPKIEYKYVAVRNPLVAMICIANKKDENDLQAKRKDYSNTILTFNTLLKLDIVYQSIINNDSNDNGNNSNNSENKPNEDEKNESKQETTTKFNFIKNSKLSNNEINTTQFQLIWTKKDIISYLKQVSNILDNETEMKNEDNIVKHDGLIVILTAPSFKGASYAHVFDSSMVPLAIGEIFDPFRAANSKFAGKNNDFLRFFMIDRYFHVDSKEEAFKVHFDKINQSREYLGETMLREDLAIHQFYPHCFEAAVPKANELGGIGTRVIRPIFGDKSIWKDSKDNREKHVDWLMGHMGVRIAKFGIGVRPITTKSNHLCNYYFDRE